MIHMEGIKGGGGGRVEDHDMGDGMQCIDHPFRNNNPGGICALCLQEKLGKLVSSSLPLPLPAPSSSPSSPSFRSNVVSSVSITAAAATSAAPPVFSSSSSSLALTDVSDSRHNRHDYYSRRTRLPFLLAKKKKKKGSSVSGSSVSGSSVLGASVSGATSASDKIILKRSKSTATPRRRHSLIDAEDDTVDFSPRKRHGFWSFLYLSSKSSVSSSNKKLNSKSFRDSNHGSTPNPRILAINTSAATGFASTASKLKEKCCSGSSLGRKSDIVVEEDNNSSASASASVSSFERKVSRSRSVGCGSRSFSGDFFERISTGFGDCTLRRVESQREGKTKTGENHHHNHRCMKERVRCGGLFSGFMMTSSSSSSSSSSYWVSSSADDAAAMNSGKSTAVALSHGGRGRSWGWAFASPMRAFSSKNSSKDNKRDIIRDANDKNATPNLSAIPSLLAARS
ncbi:suppressor protein SRP40 [Lotus japonicus]|uniref:suppressor protein SRP40 n=1 Tax=Lotus japonicus TaxID=34305 RepID=UPI00258E6CE3|nr:suppressor protein SRP40 [Lotus japonicus]